MNQRGLLYRNRWAAALLAMIVAAFAAVPCSAAQTKWTRSVIYCVYPIIFSEQGDLPGVTAQLGRLHHLGVDIVWLMPVTPIGQAVGNHPAFNSPYCVQNYFAVNPKYGSAADLKALVLGAHRLHMKVILDEVLNHTAWDNPLIEKHPEYYVHSDDDPKNPLSIKQAFNFSDVAQLNYANHDLWRFMDTMLAYWITTYHIDGFRFDTANDPDGPNRMISAAFWQDLGRHLTQVDHNVLMLGECETPDLAEKPFQIDYGWNMYGALKDASSGGSAETVLAAYAKQTSNYPPGMLHMAIQDDWDTPRDVNTFGGATGARAAAVFNFTSYGVPLIYNGMEIGNAAEAVNPHALIDWRSGNLAFTSFYQQLIALRRNNPALEEGSTTWLDNSAPKQVLTYMRSGGGSEFLIVDNLSSAPADGEIVGISSKGWSAINITESQPLQSRKMPHFRLGPKAFAIYRRSRL